MFSAVMVLKCSEYTGDFEFSAVGRLKTRKFGRAAYVAGFFPFTMMPHPFSFDFTFIHLCSPVFSCAATVLNFILRN